MSKTTEVERLVVNAGPGMQLVLYPREDGIASVNMVMGTWPRGRTVLFIASRRERVARDVDGIWFDNTKIDLPWASILAVADFLQLDIPLPHRLGEQVPA